MLNDLMTEDILIRFLELHAEQMRLREVDLSVPRLSFDEETKLIDDFPQWPMMQSIQNSIFSETFLNNKGEGVSVDQMINRTQMKLDEQGVEVKSASAVTGILEGACLGVPSFNVNRPFGYLFWDKGTQTILATGRVTNLAEKNSK